METKKKRKIFLLIDSNSLIHRAYHALPPLTTKKGEPIGAVYGFLLTLFKIIKETRPDYIAAAFDYPAPTFRHKEFKKYKAKRPPLPKDLSSQIPKVKEFLRALKIPIFEKKGFEADDLIGTLCKMILRRQIFPKLEIIILSGDLDLLQLINPSIKVFFLKTGTKNIVVYNKKEVEKRYGGILPSQILDYKALRGDPSDNIPGVSGIGEKTAINLINNFGDLKSLYRHLENKTNKSKKLSSHLRKSLLAQKEQAFFSRSLAQIKKNIELKLNLEKCRWGEYEKKDLIRMLKKFQFYTLLNRLFPEEEKKIILPKQQKLIS